MRFVITEADFLTGAHAIWEMECDSIQQARERVIAAGYKVADIKPVSDPAQIARTATGPVRGNSVAGLSGIVGQAVLDPDDSGVFPATTPFTPNRLREPISPASMTLGGRRAGAGQPAYFPARRKKNRHPAAIAGTVAGIAVLGCGVSLLLYFFSQNAGNAQTASATDKTLSAQSVLPADTPAPSGTNGTLLTPDGSDIILAATAEDYTRVTQLSAIHDQVNLNEMVSTGQAWRITSGSTCLIIERGVLISEVRISGGTNDGQTGWVASDFLSH